MASPDLRRPGHPLGGVSSPTGMLVASEKASSVRIKGFERSCRFRSPGWPGRTGNWKAIHLIAAMAVEDTPIQPSWYTSMPSMPSMYTIAIHHLLHKNQKTSVSVPEVSRDCIRKVSNPHGHAQQRTGDQNRRVLCKLFLFVILKSQGLYTNLSIPTFKHDIEWLVFTILATRLPRYTNTRGLPGFVGLTKIKPFPVDVLGPILNLEYIPKYMDGMWRANNPYLGYGAFHKWGKIPFIIIYRFLRENPILFYGW